MSAPIFINYSSKDQKIAETFCRALEARGYNCWIAVRNVGPGENFPGSHRQGAAERAFDDSGIHKQCQQFERNQKGGRSRRPSSVTVVPVRVEDVAPNDALAYECATRQWIDLFTDWEREIERLVSQIGGLLSEGASTGSAPAGETCGGVAEKSFPGAPARKKSPLRPLLLLLLPVVVGLVLGTLT